MEEVLGVKIKYCPVCMQELEQRNGFTWYCKLCEFLFYIAVTQVVGSPNKEVLN